MTETEPGPKPQLTSNYFWRLAVPDGSDCFLPCDLSLVLHLLHTSCPFKVVTMIIAAMACSAHYLSSANPKASAAAAPFPQGTPAQRIHLD